MADADATRTGDSAPGQLQGRPQGQSPGQLQGQSQSQPPGATAALVLADGTVFWGLGLGAPRVTVGEICFNTAMTGYQEIMTDPSYAGQIITFTFPHIGNVGANGWDIEAMTPFALGLILRAPVTAASNYRSDRPRGRKTGQPQGQPGGQPGESETGREFDAWLTAMNLPGISGVDTRRLTRRIRDLGAPSGVLAHAPDGRFDMAALRQQAADWPGLEGMDLAGAVSCRQTYEWREGTWSFGTESADVAADGAADGAGAPESADAATADAATGKDGYRIPPTPGPDDKRPHVVVMDFGVKRNILRSLCQLGCRVTVVPARTDGDDILALGADGVFLGNGPGDPAATAVYAAPQIRKIIDSGTPIFGICLGHQLLSLALGGRTEKMHLGHRGGNHPVKDLASGKVEITSQNHGFMVSEKGLPANVKVTHRSLFDGTIEGISVQDKPIFSVQHHPEASPGPGDSHHLFARFVDLIKGSH